ncbi:3-oxo-tetronate kinase [Naasia sp. SYSU D00057]|uniref:3-oxo-tetronate kinase n=1 Tax=Naasia sp. SYSU D00057 TaxID=2817380 RepID=UPI001B308E83|nr:3-oxo-tetronate kinase [Naasia sp. SYSU D00057]
MIGAIADDFTGATDVAVAFRRAGLRTVVLFGLPSGDLDLPEHDAVVVGLKTRTIPTADAVDQSLAAADWLETHGARQFYFKYCSTFDSRPDGNIGPVADALAERFAAGLVAMVPASPEHGRTQYLGYLFVGPVLLSESPMRHHPLTPMTDSFIPRVLEPQTSGSVGLIAHDVVRRGPYAVAAELARHADIGDRYAVIDAIEAADLVAIGGAVVDHVLIGGGAGLAGGLGRALAAAGRAVPETLAPDPVGQVPAVVLAGSCSYRTLEQVAVMLSSHDSYFLDAAGVPDAAELARRALAWYDSAERSTPPLIYSSVPPQQLRRVQDELGVDAASRILEDAAGRIATGLVARGVRRLVVAGGETSGAVVGALGATGGVIGAEAAPGVPWIYTPDGLALLLKSGNFGDPELLVRAVSIPSDQEVRA